MYFLDFQGANLVKVDKVLNRKKIRTYTDNYTHEALIVQGQYYSKRKQVVVASGCLTYWESRIIMIGGGEGL